MNDGEVLMHETLRAALRRQRDEFQEAHPKYTPPPWDPAPREGERISRAWWAWTWVNRDLHGREGFIERFRTRAWLLEAVPIVGPEF